MVIMTQAVLRTIDYCLQQSAKMILDFVIKIVALEEATKIQPEEHSLNNLIFPIYLQFSVLSWVI
jgi:hypothetical protein